MKKLVFAVLTLLCLFAFSSCKVSKKEDVNAPQEKITIETFATTSDGTATQDTSGQAVYSTPETENTDVLPEVTTAPTEELNITSVCEPAVTEKTEYVISDYEAKMYAAASVNVRAKPDADSSRIGHLDAGDEVYITGIVSNGWFRIKFKGKEYFVNGRYLSDIRETEPEKTEQTTIETTVTTTVTTEKPVTTVTEPLDDEIEIEDDDFENIFGTRNYTAINYSVQKAVWFAYLDIDAMLAGSNVESFTASIREAFYDVYAMGCNTVYVHVRAFGDAYYYSDLYPFAASYSGTLGIAPDFDPLQIMIDEAHKLGLSFHAWINPMRTANEKRYGEMSSWYPLKQWHDSSSANGTYIVYDEDSGYYWLSPAYSAARELICMGIAEICTRYDVDGIHIDDYFYPTTDESFDKLAFSVSGADDLAQWRRDTVSVLVADIYKTVKKCNPTVLFGVSPQGNLSNNKNKLYADVERWCSSYGYLDYIVPQIYYGYKDKLPFDDTALQWQSIVTNPNVKLVCGIAAYKVGSNSEWKSGDILSRQTEYINSLKGYSGCAYYRHGTMFNAGTDDKYIKEELKKLITSLAFY